VESVGFTNLQFMNFEVKQIEGHEFQHFNIQTHGWLASKPLPLVNKRRRLCRCIRQMRQKNGPEKLKSQVNPDKKTTQKLLNFMAKIPHIINYSSCTINKNTI